jgi:heme/copper-type cytochrome/quinol oxidase subunit 2
MPIVVEAKTQQEFDKWLAEHKVALADKKMGDTAQSTQIQESP